MAEVIDVEKKKPKIIVTEVKPAPAPDLSFLNEQQFQREAVIVLEDRLLQLGIVIPRDRIKRLAPALTEIGKLYYSLASDKLLF